MPKKPGPGDIEITSKSHTGDVRINFVADAELSPPADRVDLWLTIARLEGGGEISVASAPYYLSSPDMTHLHIDLTIASAGPGLGHIRPLSGGRYLARLVSGKTVVAKGEFSVNGR